MKTLAPKLLEAIEKCQGIAAHHFTPSTRDGVSAEDTLDELFLILDDQNLCKAIREYHESQKAETILEKFWPESSQIARTKYYPEFKTLEVEFKSNGKAYHYFNVESEVWKTLLTIESIGSFINKEVKGKYEYELLLSQDERKLKEMKEEASSKPDNIGGL